MLSKIMTDTITILKQNGQELGPIKASVQRDKIFTISHKILIEPNDLIQRKMSNGGTETFRVIDPCYYEEIHKIPAHYQIHVHKLGISEPNDKGHGHTYHVSINGHNARFNNNSTDNSTNATHLQNSNKVIDELKKAITEITDASINKKDLLEIAEEIGKQILHPEPNKTLLKSLLSTLPPADNILSITASLMSLIPH